MNVLKFSELLTFINSCWPPFVLQVDFVSTTVKKYEIALVVDVDGVGEEILSLPIIAK